MAQLCKVLRRAAQTTNGKKVHKPRGIHTHTHAKCLKFYLHIAASKSRMVMCRCVVCACVHVICTICVQHLYAKVPRPAVLLPCSQRKLSPPRSRMSRRQGNNPQIKEKTLIPPHGQSMLAVAWWSMVKPRVRSGNGSKDFNRNVLLQVDGACLSWQRGSASS